jgi:mucin-2/type VI secretion system secreted protein VgrG
MESLRQIGAGILLGIISIVVLLGGFSLAMVEGGMVPAVLPPSPTADTSVSIVVTIFPTLPLPISATPVSTDTPASNLTATASLTPPPTLTICQPPTGWVVIIVQSSDTLISLSQVYRTSVDLLRTKNCLLNDQLVPGSILYVPPLPTSTIIACGAPANWGSYTVVPGDTLYRISILYRVTVQQLMQANCLQTSNINAGQVLRVPRVPTSTPATTNTPFPTLTEVPSLTPVPTTEVPSSTMTASQTSSATPTITATPLVENP